MPGFSSNDQVIAALSGGQTYKAQFGKNFNPTAAAVANEWHTLFRGAGNPAADALFNTGTALSFQPVRNDTANGTPLQTGGVVQPSYYKYLLSAWAATSAATTAPGTLAVVDVVGFYRVTAVTTTTAQSTTNTLSLTDTFTANINDTLTYSSTTNYPSNLLTGTRVRVSTTIILPGGLAAATDYYLIRIDDNTFYLATSYANAKANTRIDITTTGTGTHTLSWLLPRYTDGAGLQAIIFNPNSVAMGAGTPNLSFPDYSNQASTTGRATPVVLPIGKTAASNSHILYTGATGTGKYNYTVPLQGSDFGISQINSIQNSTSYVSGEYCVALVNEITQIPLAVLGQAAERNLLNEMPSLPRIYDGAALYFVWGSGAATPASSAFTGALNFIWN